MKISKSKFSRFDKVGQEPVDSKNHIPALELVQHVKLGKGDEILSSDRISRKSKNAILPLERTGEGFRKVIKSTNGITGKVSNILYEKEFALTEQKTRPKTPPTNTQKKQFVKKDKEDKPEEEAWKLWDDLPKTRT